MDWEQKPSMSLKRLISGTDFILEEIKAGMDICQLGGRPSVPRSRACQQAWGLRACEWQTPFL